jgi:hypothetical protein
MQEARKISSSKAPGGRSSSRSFLNSGTLIAPKARVLPAATRVEVLRNFLLDIFVGLCFSVIITFNVC